jgi:ABC-type Zn uptake system ZnuABC Zn-binding protein ZnuA
MEFLIHCFSKQTFTAILLVFLVCLFACVESKSDDSAEATGSKSIGSNSSSGTVTYAVSVYPLKLILDELTIGRAQVNCFMRPGESPHTFEPIPSDMASVSNATAFFWVSDNLDGWAVDVDTKNKVKVVDLLPGSECVYFDHKERHQHADVNVNESNEQTIAEHDGQTSEPDEVVDPHFWTSPRAVLKLVEPLTDKLIEFDPAGAEIYRKNSAAFTSELSVLDADVSTKLVSYKGENLILFHPSFLYYMRDYNLELVGVVEPFPGKEPTPKQIADLKKQASKYNVKALYTEPQLPRQSVKVLVAETGLPLFELDPLGGSDGRTDYKSLIEYNTGIFLKAFKGK